jgi:uncharacterized protein YciW
MIKDKPIMPALERLKFSHVSEKALRRLTGAGWSTVTVSTAIVFLRFQRLTWFFYSLTTGKHSLLSARELSANGD